ncbi:MAG: hypothetical protein H7Y02_09475, partial [Candidatus Obscuribacterales bacterium]|nr:hypothetical protein [Steroidobacteraceae bacterium]
QVRDFQFPQAFTAVRVAVTQNAVILASANSATTLSITSAASGPIDIVIAATPAASANGLLGISVTPQATSTPIWEATQAIGGLFKSRTVALAAAGRYDLSAVDAQFPAALTEFALVITRGATLIGQVYAAGGTAPTQLRIDASPGEYTVNLIATASASENYGVYGIKLEDVPAAPAPTPPPVASPATTSESGGGSMGMEALLMALFTLGLRLRSTARSSSRRD